MELPRVLVIGYGNPGRRDDGLGPALAAELERLNLPHLRCDSDYQLTVEDAATVAQHDLVIFVDADASGPEPFSFRRIGPGRAVTFSSHSLRPESVLTLAQDLFGARTEGYLLAVRGYEFDEFGEGLSGPARANLQSALRFIHAALRDGSVRQSAAPAGQAPADRAKKGDL